MAEFNALDKFGRNYRLYVQKTGTASSDSDNLLLIEPPFTIEFDIQRHLYSSASSASIRIYNLNEKSRNFIRKDQNDAGTLQTVLLQAGYGDNLPVILNAQIYQAWSVREGDTFITEIVAYDGGFAFQNANIDRQYKAGTPYKAIITDLVTSLSPFGVSVGVISGYVGSTPRGSTYSGSTTEILRQLTGGGFFIDNGVAHCIQQGETIVGATPLFNAESGLLNTPIRQQLQVTFDIVFEPRLYAAQQILVESLTGDRNITNAYKVQAIHHKGMISDSICGDAVTSVTADQGVFTEIGVGV